MNQASNSRFPKKLSYAEKRNIAVNTILNDGYDYHADQIACQIDDIHPFGKCKTNCSIDELVSLWFDLHGTKIAA